MKLSYNELWAEAVGLVRAHRAALVAIAGVFVFLPDLLVGHFAPFEPRQQVPLHEQFADHLRANWPLILGSALMGMVGTLTMLNLFLKPDGRTVGAAIAAAAALLLSFLAASIIANLILFLGVLALIVPGIYLLGRLTPLGAVIVAENRRNPIDAIGRTFGLTRGFGFAIAGIVILVYIVALVANLAVTRVLGSAAILLAGRELGMLIAVAAGAAVWAAATVLLVALAAAIYRRLRGRDSAAPAAGSAPTSGT